MEFVKVNGNFNEEDEEIVESMESNLAKVENLRFWFHQGTSFQAFLLGVT